MGRFLTNIYKIRVLSILFVLFCFSCRVKLDNTLPDFDTVKHQAIERELSLLSLPIQIPVAALEAEINRQFTGIIYEDNCYDLPEVDNVMLRVSKTRDIKVQAAGEFLRFDIPLRIWAKYRWKACDFCPQIEKETSFNIVVGFTTKIGVKADWKLETKTIPSGLQFETKPRIDFGVVSIPITSIVEPIIREELVTITKDIDKEIAQNFDFSASIDSVWRELHKPQLIDAEYNAWLKISPSEVFMSPIRSNNQNIRLVVAFKGGIEVVFGKEPTVKRTNPLPLLKTLETPNNDFNIFIESFVNFENATLMARQHLQDTVFDIGSNRSIKIDDIAFMGYGDKVYTKVDLSRSIKGTIYFKGTPAYDKENQVIYLKDFDYDLKSKNILFKSANWIMYGAFKNRLEKEFRYSLKDDLKESRKLINTLLGNYEFENLFTLQGRLNALDIHDIIVERDGLRIIINAEGNAQIKIISLEF